jgi:hypothetical protein
VVTDLLAGPGILDFADLDQRPLKRIRSPLAGLDHPHLLRIVGTMPGEVRHSWRRAGGSDETDEHSLVSPSDGSMARIVLWWDRTQARTVAGYTHIGPRDLVAELLARIADWERHGRAIPEHWPREDW